MRHLQLLRYRKLTLRGMTREVMMGFVWRLISPLLKLDEVVTFRTAAHCRNAGFNHGPHGVFFVKCVRRFGGLHNDVWRSPN